MNQGADIDGEYFWDGNVPGLKDDGIALDDEAIAAALINIYKKKYGKGAIEPSLFLATAKKINLAAAMGLSDAVANGAPMPGNPFLEQIKHGNEVFSAFRAHRMAEDIARRMVDDKGNLKPFSKFAKDVAPYVDHQNRAWLRTEYNTAVERAHQAADWQRFEQEKEVLPNLEWTPSLSPNPGADHRPFWGTVLPIDHPFWDEHKPGDRWNCKCGLRNTNEPTDNAPVGGNGDNPSPGLDNNQGKDGHLFSDKHPYFPKSCAACPIKGGKLTALLDSLKGGGKKGKQCYDCGYVDNAISKATLDKARQEYDAFNPDQYEKTFFDKKTGGYVVTERKRLLFAKKSKNEIAKYVKEKDMCFVFANGGNKIVHRYEPPGTPSPDVFFNGIPADLKRTGSEGNILREAVDAIKKKGAKIVIIQFDVWDAKMSSALKNIIESKIHGKYIVTGKEDNIVDF